MSVLDDLVAGAIEDARARRADLPYRELERSARSAPPARDAVAALTPAGRITVIAEIKRASPSRGPIAAIEDPAAHALGYQAGGASAISVLTEGRRFRGSLDDLRAVRAAVELPVLRKDFIVDEYQILEARAAGADFVLLIVAALDQARLAALLTFAADLGMAALVETHSIDEVHSAVGAGARIVGVNARNLHDFTLDTDLFGGMVAEIPESAIRVAESAVLGLGDVEKYAAAGADAVLVGEALVRGDAVRLLAEFTAVPASR